MPILRPPPTKRQNLENAIRNWWDNESSDWDQLVTGESPSPVGGADLWDTMPQLDSKAVARSSHIFEAELGIKLDVKLIKKGGYDDIESMIDHLVPKMCELAEYGP